MDQINPVSNTYPIISSFKLKIYKAQLDRGEIIDAVKAEDLESIIRNLGKPENIAKLTKALMFGGDIDLESLLK